MEWWIWLLIGSMLGYMVEKNQHGILCFFRDVDNQVYMGIAGIFTLGMFGIVGLEAATIFDSLAWLLLPAFVCDGAFLGIMGWIYQPWKVLRKRKQK